MFSEPVQAHPGSFGALTSEPSRPESPFNPLSPWKDRIISNSLTKIKILRFLKLDLHSGSHVNKAILLYGLTFLYIFIM